jgi:flavin reductase (DIM6/NTAB) family NADH-FMN oxidoreductase RutF
MTKISIPNRPLGPFPAMLVGALVEGQPNYATVGACGVVCLDPILYISLRSTHHTTKGVRDSGYFSVNIPSTTLVDKVDFCGMHSGGSVDKAGLFTTFYDPARLAPMIQECPINYLCKVIRTIPINDFEMFLGEILSVHADSECVVDGVIAPGKVDPILLFGMDYWGLGSSIGSVFKNGKSVVPKTRS